MRNKKSSFISLVFLVCWQCQLLLPVVSASVEDGHRVNMLLQQSYDMERQNNYAVAADLLKQACALDFNNSALHLRYGWVLNHLQKNDEATQEFLIALKLNRYNKEAWTQLITSYISRGNLKAALASCKECLPFMPTDKQSAMKKLIEDLNSESDQGAAQNTADYFSSAIKYHEAIWSSNKMPIKVYIDNGATVSGVKPQYQEIIRDAFLEWQSAANGKVSFIFISSKSSADIITCWSNDRSTIQASIEGGDTSLEVNVLGSVCSIKSATITLMPCAISIQNAPLVVRLVALHEVGHALGIEGHSPNPTDVMYPFAVSVRTGPHLSLRDKNTLQKLYLLDMEKPDRVLILTEQSRDACKKGDFAQAAQELKEACEIEPSACIPHCLYGLVLNHLGKNDEAKSHLLEAIQLNKNEPMAWRSLGAFYAATGNLIGAENSFKECLRLNPGDTDVEKALLELQKKCPLIR